MMSKINVHLGKGTSLIRSHGQDVTGRPGESKHTPPHA